MGNPKHVVAYSPDGKTISFWPGVRVSWDNPCGIGGVTLTGTFVGASFSRSNLTFMGPEFVGIKTDPSDGLADIYARLDEKTIQSLTINPRGGMVVIAGEAFDRSVAEGRLRVIGPGEHVPN